jgi:hypothetical protein
MKTLLVPLALVYSAAAFAQSPPPTVGDRPLLQVKPRAEAAKSGKAQPLAVRLQACTDLEDGSKGRLDCYDEVIKPQPKPKSGKATSVMDCRFTKEEDERLACFNDFVERLPKLPRS